MMTTGTGTLYTITAPEGATTTNYKGDPFAVEEVEWSAYVYEGRAYRLIRCRGTQPNGESSNATLSLDHDRAPEWMPKPPAEWFALAEQIAPGAATS